MDGYIGDGHYNWSMPAEGSTAFISRTMSPFGIYLYGRKNYDTMSFWESDQVDEMGADDKEFARIWRAADKVVFSKSLDSVKSKKTKIEKDFNPIQIRKLKESSKTDICIGGPNLAHQAIAAGLIDEVILFVVPDTIGNTLPKISVLPKDIAIKLELIETCSFSKGWVYLRYRIR